MTFFPKSWLPKVHMRGIVVHWTAGNHKAGAVDRRAYHLLIEGDGKPVRAVPIERNSGKLSTGYAAHTRACNTNFIGLSLCSMRNAKESPFNAGSQPLTETQWERLGPALAQLSTHYNIPVTNKTILTHAEVQPNLGIRQNAKWDITRLPFDLSIRGAKAVGDLMRRNVIAALGGKVIEEAADPVPAGGIGVVVRLTAGKNLNFRRDPNGSIIGSLPIGTRVEIIGNSGEWLETITPAGHKGWVSGRFIDIVDGPPAEGSTEPSDARRLANALAQIEGAL